MRVGDYELLYDLPDGAYEGRGIDGVRTVTIRAGRSLEVMCCPITKLTAEARREARERRTSPAMQRLNIRNAERHIMRLMEMNFTPRAWVVTGTYAYPTEDYGMGNLRELADAYEERGLPWERERMVMDFRNFLNKLKRRVKKAGGEKERLTAGKAKPASAGAERQDAGETRGQANGAAHGADIKWIVRYEEGKNPPAEGLPPKYHWHALIEGEGVTREMIDECWPHGHTKCESFITEDDGPARLARYICKEKPKNPGKSWWSHSRNLKIPTPKVSERKMSRRRLAKVAADVQHNGREIFEKLYPGYKVVELPDVRYSDFVAGAYIYARLRRIDAGEPWARTGKNRGG
ncbi:MAG: hypothetical protein IJ769_00780 [Clostridia bacterium]|nr:hypothetical protein [Clostridia bacterium]